MKRAYSPKDIAAKKWVTLPWGEKWCQCQREEQLCDAAWQGTVQIRPCVVLEL